MTIFFLAALFSSAAHASSFDPQYHRELERQNKAAQARLFHKRMARQDFAEAPAVSVKAYHFDLTAFPSEGKLKGAVEIELVAQTDVRVLVLDAIDLHVNKVWFTDQVGARSEAVYESASSEIKILAPKIIASGTSFRVTVDYEVTGDRRNGTATNAEKGLFFVNADESQSEITPSIYTSTEPQLSPTWFPCIDDPAAKAERVSMRLTVPAGWTAVSNGALKSTSPNPGTRTTTFEWEHDYPIATYLISIAAAPYTMIQENLGALPVQYFVPKALEDKARIDFDRTPEMIEHFSNLWAKYPYAKYAMATVPLYGGAMEHTTATTMAENFVLGDRDTEWLVAHELAHHWWGDTVTNATWDDLWLNEGFATFGETVFLEHFFGADKALESFLNNRDAYFESDPEGKHAVVDPSDAPDEKFGTAVYEKGGWILRMLREKLGHEAFDAGLRSYYQAYAFKNATTADLEGALEAASGKDLKSFFQQWVFSPGYPELNVSWSHYEQGQFVKVEIEQPRDFEFSLELVLAVRMASGAIEQTPFVVSVHKGSQEVSLTLPSGVAKVIGLEVDPRAKILAQVNVERSEEEIAYWVTQGDWLARRAALEDASAGELSVGLARTVAAALSHEPSASVRTAALGYLGRARKVKGLTDADFAEIQKAIRASLTHAEAGVRVAAATAAKSYLSPEFTEYVAERFLSETSPRVKAALARALAHGRYARAFDLFCLELDRFRRVEAYEPLMMALIDGFGRLGDKRAAAILTDLVGGPNPFFQRAALESLGSLAVPETFEFIVQILRDEARSIELRVSSANALANYGGLSAAAALQDQLKVEQNETLKKAIAEALKKMGGKPDSANLLLRGSPVFLRW